MQESSIIGRRMERHAGYAFIEVVAGLAAAGLRAVSHQLSAFAEARHRAQARIELRQLSDRTLKDIGVARGDIDSLFR